MNSDPGFRVWRLRPPTPGVLPVFLIATALLTPLLLLLAATHFLDCLWLLGLLGLVVLIYWTWHAWPRLPFIILWGSALLTRLRFDVGSVTVRPAHLALLLLAPMLLWQLYRRQKRFYLTWPGFFAVSWWLLLALAAFAHAPNYADTLRNQIRLGMMVAIYLLTVNLLRDDRDWQWAWRAFLVIAAGEAAFGLLARLFYPHITFGVQVMRSLPVPIPYGTLEEGNIFGSSNAAWAIFFLALLLSTPLPKIITNPIPTIVKRRTHWQTWLGQNRWWLFLLAGTLLTLSGLLLSLARAAWVSFTAVVLLLWLFLPIERQVRQRRLFWLVGIVGLGALVVASIWQFLPADGPLLARLHTLGDLANDSTFSGRLHDWLFAYHDWQVFPWLGWGPGTFVQIHGRLRGSDAWLSNITFRALQESGILGSLALSGFLLTLFGAAFQRIRRAPATWRQPLLGLTLGFLLLIMAYQATDGSWLALPWIYAALIERGSQLSPGNEVHNAI